MEQQEEEEKNILVLIRGIPGSGKSTLAHNIAPLFNAIVIEADDYFINTQTKEYEFDARFLYEAHATCLGVSSYCLKNNLNVIVANNFAELWELKKYIEVAKKLGIKIYIIQCNNEFKNIHGIPEEKVLKIKKKFVDNKDLKIPFYEDNIIFEDFIVKEKDMKDGQQQQE